MVESKIRVIIIDDDVDDFTLIRDFLSSVRGASYEIEWVSKLTAAHEALRSQTHDIYLLDYRLGGKTGLELLNDVRSESELLKPVLLLTSGHDRDVDMAAMESGVDDFLPKSDLSSDLLERSIRYAIKRAKDREALKRAECFRIDKEAAELANKAKSRFLANVSHEIRTPLSSILGFTDLALDPNYSTEERGEFLSTIKRNGEHLLELLTDILDLSKVEAGHIQIVMQKFDWREVLMDVLHLFQGREKSNKIKFSADIPSLIPKFLISDGGRFRQIIVNLVSNAYKFTHEGFVSVEAKVTGNGLTSAILEISVRDSGIGIDKANQEKLFQPFEQLSTNIEQKMPGTGLGLDLSRQLAKALGGNLVLESSKPNFGSVFTLTLPANFATNEIRAEEKPTVKSQSTGLAPTAPVKVLLVEDTADVQKLVRHFLRDFPADLSIVSDGESAIKQALKKPFDVVLMDIQMPGIDGFEATRQLRSQGYTKPIIALTAHALADDRVRGLQNGFTDYLAKPISKAQLLHTLENVAAVPAAQIVK